MSDKEKEIEQQAEQVLEQLSAKKPEDLGPEQMQKLDQQFEAKLRRTETDANAPREMLDQLRVLWRMLKAPDDVVSWRAKAMIMGAISYFVSPLDLIPDTLGRAGYFDDAMIVRIVYNRLSDEIQAFIAQ
jgi:uncharacterized membrane protein YkvA (DUF1232 family)